MTSDSQRAFSPTPSTPSARERRGVPIRVLVATIAVLPALVLAVVLVTLMTITVRRVSERLEESMLRTATEQVGTDVKTFLDDAVRISDLYARRAEAGELPLANLGPWERPLLEEMAVSPGIAAISFGNQRGEGSMVLRRRRRVEVDRVGPNGAAATFLVDATGTGVSDRPMRRYTFDPRGRPWYAAALAAGRPSWTPVYSWQATEDSGDAGNSVSADHEVGTGYARPISDAQGKVAGVLLVDVTLGGLSEFLRTLPIASEGHVFVVDDQGLIVAASTGTVTTTGGERIAFSAADPRLAQLVMSSPRPKESKQAEAALRGEVDGIPMRIRSSLLSLYPGVKWHVVAAVPERVLLGQAWALLRWGLVSSGAAVLAALAFGVFFSRRLSKPITALASHVQQLGAGYFDSRLNLRAAREFKALSVELNRMAGGLRQRMELEKSLALAAEVQKSLLPQESPSSPGLDIAGKSRYCDATGGDYFDFIEVVGRSDGQILVAVGDVMGHGIASALLMATARGALRARTQASAHSLSDLLVELNRVLAKDTSAGRFMTMILLTVDPNRRTVRWASAGHGPPFIYDRRTARFAQVKGGDIPLGIDGEAAYHEHTVTDLAPDALIFLGTDGIWEAVNAEGAMFGEERLRAIIGASAGLPSADVLSAIDEGVSEFCGARPARDDITAVVIQTKAAVPNGTDAR